MEEADEKPNKEDFLEDARERAKAAWDAWQHNFEQMDEDIRMLSGDQWPDDIKRDRENKKRPVLTFNKLAPIHDQIIGEQRQMRPGITVFPTQADNEKVKNIAGTKDYTKAEVYEALIKNIEYCSNADMAYDTSFEHCSGHGLGYFTMETEWAGDSFEQDLRIRRVRNYKSVLIDPDIQEPDGSDMEWGFIFSKIKKDKFEKKYPDKKATSIEHKGDQYEIWVDGEYVLTASYYYLKAYKTMLYLLSDGRTIEGVEFEKVKDELAQAGITVLRQRETTCKRCYWAKISGVDILEGNEAGTEGRETVFNHVPIFPVLGKEIVVDGTPIYRGSIRYSRDAQQMYNYSRTADVERTAFVPKVPFLIGKSALNGFKKIWDQLQHRNLSYLVWNDEKPTTAMPQRVPPVSTNPGEVEQSMQANDDIKATSGMFDPSMGNTSNASSGRQELILQNKGFVGTFAFSDNLTRTMRHAGKVLIEAIPRVYDSARIIRLRFPDDTEDFVAINQAIKDRQTGEVVKIHDISYGKYDAVVKAGPSFTTQRMQAAETITQFAQSVAGADPILAKALSMLAAENMDWPGADKVVDIIRKTLPEGLVDNPEEGENAPPPPTPEEIQQMAAEMAQKIIEQPEMQAKLAKAQADMAQAEADMAKADADKTKAQAEIVKATQPEQPDLNERVKDIVAEAFAELLTQQAQG